ncbi:MAG TPA: hypothetical protein VF177_13815 [Anaerolineae bacterium]
MLLVGFVLGLLGGLLDRTWGSLASAALLIGVFGLYNHILKRNNGILSGLVAGSMMGVVVGIVGFLAGGTIDGPLNGASFGLVRGAAVGAVAGVITRAQPDPGDKLLTRLFLAIGSVVVGAFLGAGVGLVAGAILGTISAGTWGLVKATLLGAIVGGYLSSYDRIRCWIVGGAILGALLAVASTVTGGAVAGVILGALSGAVAPMLLVALIGAYGGLTGRGWLAMVVEALEAPSEMLMQGAVPFLAPAMMVGVIVGTAAAGVGGLIALRATLALVGILLGVLGEFEGRTANRITVRSIVEMVILGADEWPVDRIIDPVLASSWKKAVVGVALGAVLGLSEAAVGVLVSQALAGMIQ